jgi:hypothetical protein
VDSLSSERDTFADDPFALDHDGQGAFPRSTASHHSRRGVVAVEKDKSTRESRLASVYESSYAQNSRVYSSVTHDQNADHERRIAVLERTVEGLLDLDLRMTQSHGDYKRLLRELQLAGVPLQRFGRGKAEDDLRKT